MENSTTKVIVTEEFMEENKELLQEFEDLKIGDEIEIESNNELVLHPILLLLKDNFEFTPGNMDVYFFGALYRLLVLMTSIAEKEQNEELNQLLEVYKHFIMSSVQKCSQDGFIEPVLTSELENKFQEYSSKIIEEIQKIKKEEETK
jgi:hypothetical protein